MHQIQLMYMANLDLIFAKHILSFSFQMFFFICIQESFLIIITYQAARATASMPGYFEPFVYGPDRLQFVDGSVVESNPTGILFCYYYHFILLFIYWFIYLLVYLFII